MCNQCCIVVWAHIQYLYYTIILCNYTQFWSSHCSEVGMVFADFSLVKCPAQGNFSRTFSFDLLSAALAPCTFEVLLWHFIGLLYEKITGQSANCKMNQLDRAEMKHLATYICVNMHRMSNTFPKDVASTLSSFVRPQVSYCITMCTM